MFRSLRSSTLPVDHVFAVTVGASAKQTLARWHLVEPPDVISAIAMLNESVYPGNIHEAGPGEESIPDTMK